MKTYIAQGRMLTIFVNANGRQNAVRFRDNGQLEGTCSYATNDPEIAKAIENYHTFGTYIFLKDGSIEQPKEEAKEEEAKEVFTCKRTQDAVKILVARFGVPEGSITRKVEVLAKAKELNISFPNL